MTTNDKLALIVAKQFTYVGVSYIDGKGDLKFDHFVVLTPSKPVAKQAAEAIVGQRLGEAGQTVLPPQDTLNYLTPNSGATIRVYPGNYVRKAKQMLQSDPQSVYAVESTTTVTFGA